ncbi:uncharacterized protein LOC128548783 [Mercenaria mercenaria]|uniref:uncharacterized protein LOC128548783 n=1 Tax=Mercenaria mercenaria TaxID=6596 RepID=UPI00234E6109|nr:uncharacterized protein LOC128548783 [Mercenaria mercenaria]
MYYGIGRYTKKSHIGDTGVGHKDAYAIPKIDDTLHLLSGAKYFSKLYLKAGYWQVEMNEKDKEKTAFQVGNLGFFECNRMPFGLCNAPATFQRLMERCMGEINLKECLIYLDDIIIFSETFEQHLERLESVFECLKNHHLKLKPSKCEFLKNETTYLGHVVSKDGIKTDPAKIETVRNWPIPRNVIEVRRFLGFAGYYRKFVPKFASIVRPLNDLLVGMTKDKKSSKIPFVWGDSQQKAFSTVIEKLTSAPVLAYANCTKSFKLHTDASQSGLGAVLYQEQQGIDRVIAYASRSLKPSERNYHASKLEFLALKWAITEKFHDYLYGAKFEVLTDNNPLTYNKPRPNWMPVDIVGKQPLPTTISQSAIKTWIRGQSTDNVISKVRELVKTGVRPTSKQGLASLPTEVKKYLRGWKQLEIVDRVLIHHSTINGERIQQVVIPEETRDTIFKALHQDMGHQGRDRATSLLKERFYWPGMDADIAGLVSRCDRCIRRKTSLGFAAGLINIESSAPMELVCIDYLSLEASKGGFENVLVITDHFTRYAQAIPTKNQAARTTAREFIRHSGHFGNRTLYDLPPSSSPPCRGLLPRRQRKPPSWMTAGEFIVGQHTFTTGVVYGQYKVMNSSLTLFSDYFYFRLKAFVVIRLYRTVQPTPSQNILRTSVIESDDSSLLRENMAKNASRSTVTESYSNTKSR